MIAVALVAALSADVAAPLADTSDTVAVVADLPDWLRRLSALDPALRDPLRAPLTRLLGVDPFGPNAKVVPGPAAFGSMSGATTGISHAPGVPPPTTRLCPAGEAHLMILHGLPGRSIVAGGVRGCHLVRLGEALSVDGFVASVLAPAWGVAPRAPDARLFTRIGRRPGLVRLRVAPASRALLSAQVGLPDELASDEVALTLDPLRLLIRVTDEATAKRRLADLRRATWWPKGPARIHDGYLVVGPDAPAHGDYRDTLPADLRPLAAGALVVLDGSPSHPAAAPLLAAMPASWLEPLRRFRRVRFVAWYDGGLHYRLRGELLHRQRDVGQPPTDGAQQGR